jgi:hypothetical protein
MGWRNISSKKRDEIYIQEDIRNNREGRIMILKREVDIYMNLLDESELLDEVMEKYDPSFMMDDNPEGGYYNFLLKCDEDGRVGNSGLVQAFSWDQAGESFSRWQNIARFMEENLLKVEGKLNGIRNKLLDNNMVV